MVPVLVPAGASFRGVLNYVLDEKKKPELVGGTVVGESARQLAEEFAPAWDRNSRVTKPVAHFILTIHPEESLTPEAWGLISERFLDGMGYKETEWVAVRHRDRDHDHVHIVASRIDLNGRRVNDSFEIKRAHKITRELSADFGLRIQGDRAREDRESLSRGEVGQWERTQEIPPRLLLQDMLDVAAGETTTIGDFVSTARALGVEVRPNIASTGHVSGISYGLDSIAFPGHKLGRDYTWQGLQDRKGLTYDAERDLPVLLSSEGLIRSPDQAPITTAAGNEGEARLETRSRVLEATREPVTLPVFIEKLAENGIQVHPNIASTGRVTGLSFRNGPHRWKASDLGTNLSWGKLQSQHHVSYDVARDLADVRRLVEKGRASSPVATISVDLDRVRSAVGEEASRADSLIDVAYRLEANTGVSVYSLANSGGEVSALEFGVGGRFYSSADLGPAYKLDAIVRDYHLGWDPKLDSRTLLAHNRAVERPGSADLDRVPVTEALHAPNGAELLELVSDSSRIRALMQVATNTAYAETQGRETFAHVESLRRQLKQLDRLVNDRDAQFADAHRSLEASFAGPSSGRALSRFHRSLEQGGAEEALRLLDRPENVGTLAYRRTAIGRRDHSAAEAQLDAARVSLRAARSLEASILDLRGVTVGYDARLAGLTSGQLSKTATLSRLKSAGRAALSHLQKSSVLYALPPQARTPVLLASALRQGLKEGSFTALKNQAVFAALPGPLRTLAIAGKSDPAAGTVYLLTSALPVPAQLAVRAIFAAGRALSR